MQAATVVINRRALRLTFNGQWSRFDNYAGPQYDDE